MTDIAWSDLTIEQRRLLLRLAIAGNGLAQEDVTGINVDELPEALHSAIGMCIDYRLVQIDVGWRGSVWIRLTEFGRHIKDDGTLD